MSTPTPQPAEAQAGPQAGTFCWNELMTRDAAKAVDFYMQLFGWRTEPMDLGQLGTYTVIKAGEKGVGGVYEMKGPEFEGAEPHWLSYIAVDDIEASVQKAQSLGATVVVPISHIPNVGKISIIEDPAGARIALYKSD